MSEPKLKWMEDAAAGEWFAENTAGIPETCDPTSVAQFVILADGDDPPEYDVDLSDSPLVDVRPDSPTFPTLDFAKRWCERRDEELNRKP